MEANDYKPNLGKTVFETLQAGMEIGPKDHRFLLIRLIGKGGMGHIWLARDLKEESVEGGERFKAVKVVHPELSDHPRALDSLKAEAVRARSLNHPNIVNVQDWYHDNDDWLFVAMEYLQGRNLDQLLHKEGGKVSWERALELLRPIVAALDYAHSQGIIHRDLKPGNIFITDQNEVKLLDFGLAYRLYRSSRYVTKINTDTGGTAEYMPPEAHLGGEPDSPAQDVYALACVIYELLVGDPPYSHQAALNRREDSYPNPPDQLKPLAWKVLKAGMAYDKKDRPQSAGELLKKLEAAQSGKKTGIGAMAIAVLAVLVIGGGYGIYQQSQQNGKNPDDELWQAIPKTIAGYQNYLEKCKPNCGYRTQAEQAIQELEQQAEQEAEATTLKRQQELEKQDNERWQNTPRTIAGYQSYLKQCQPICAHEIEAKQTIQKLNREEDNAAFASAQQLNTVQAYQNYLKRCPDCQHQQEAEAAIEELEKYKPGSTFRDKLKDGSEGPIMVVIPAGSFTIGSSKSEEERNNNKREHTVFIKEKFAIGQYEVTFAEYDLFVEATGWHRPYDEDWGRGKRPVINVN